MKRIYQTWKVPWVELINVESGDDKVEVGSVIFKLVPKIERNKLFFSWIEAEAWWLWLHLFLSFFLCWPALFDAVYVRYMVLARALNT